MLSGDLLTLTSPTTLERDGKIFDCRTGRGGIRATKVEGDGATPIGIFPLRQVFYRPDRIRPFACDLPMVSLTPIDGWCDDPTDPLYNQLIKTPYAGNHEILWREDHVYDILIVIGYNDDPVIAPKGSAIFIHLLNDDQTPTAGCIALARGDLIELLGDITPSTQLVVPAHLDQAISPLMSTVLQENHS
ncbi:MAG: L,D-transpeptidase family protein [Alphaproteobacteria bacterium]|nr:L,D-transpeptidase family protein [Alphaproteobacteria bacterium]